jgi:hypothetical protein
VTRVFDAALIHLHPAALMIVLQRGGDSLGHARVAVRAKTENRSP